MEWYTLLTEEGPQAYLKALADAGWFNWPLNDRDALAQRFQAQARSEEYVCDLYHLAFDAEGFADEQGYVQLLDEIIRISGLQVLERAVRLDDQVRRITITLTTARGTYTYTVDLNEARDRLDEDFLVRFINGEVLEAEQLEGRSFSLPIVDQIARFVFVPPALHQRAIAAEVIPKRRFLQMADDEE